MSINERIKERRIALGLSQEELAQRLGYKTKSSIAKIERANNDFPQHKISKFASALETTEAYLMGWDKEPQDAHTEKARRIAVLFMKLTPENQEFVLKQINLLLAQQAG